MKKIAFLHALLLVIFLLASWVLFFFKMNKPEDEQGAPMNQQMSGEIREQTQPDPVSPGKQQSVKKDILQNIQPIPPAWTEWINYLEQQVSARDMQFALNAMRDALFSMDPELARVRLMELIGSRVNVPTGLRFQVGRNGNLSGAPDLQTLLLDWLRLMDPVGAAQLAKSTLAQYGVTLGPDAYVIHLRNYATGTNDSALYRDQLVRNYFNSIVSNSEWTSQPADSIAESMDFAVFLEDGRMVPVLSGFMAKGQSPVLGHAGSMAIERLVDLDPIGSVSALIESVNQPGMSSTARAGFVARLDPANPQAFQLLTEYLQHPSISQQEAAAFLQYFPNLNKTFSYNLVSPEISITELGDHMDRLKSALDAVNDWQSDPVRNDIGMELSETSRRLLSQITGEPAP